MELSCSNVIDKLNKSIDNANTQLIHNMTDPTMLADFVCVKQSVQYDEYSNTLKRDWENIINEFMEKNTKCDTSVDTFMAAYNKFFSVLNFANLFQNKSNKDISFENIFAEYIYNILTKPSTNKKFVFDTKPEVTIKNLAKVIAHKCGCQIFDLYPVIVDKYKDAYQVKLKDHSREEILNIIKNNFTYLKSTILNQAGGESIDTKQNIISQITTKLSSIYSFSIESELNNLIPDSLGSMKDFFIKVISAYYNNLHPIVWAQIFKQVTENIFVELPLTPNALFQFVSKHVLLNSGPFILKILQMIRPVLSPELATKYNLTKLRYPQLAHNEIDMILRQVIPDYDMYKILANKSASVGHVCIMYRVDKPDDIFVVKIIKPVSIAQTCWEYKTLHDVYDPASCEAAFVKNMLESNGKELNVHHEIDNINKGHEYYTESYSNIYGVNIDAHVTAIQVKEHVINPSCWYALAMTLAPGGPLSDLVENDKLDKDTKFRAKLHRCLDLLVYKFFLNIVKNGYYHGDLHAGNIFFSYEQNQMTLIDFGAVGEIDIYKNDESTNTLLDIVVMSIFYNYDGILDTMTKLLNGKCVDTQIDTTSVAYQNIKTKLQQYHLNNIRNNKVNIEKSLQYKEYIFGDTRIKQEQSELVIQPPTKRDTMHSIYEYLDEYPVTMKQEPIVDNEIPILEQMVGGVTDEISLEFVEMESDTETQQMGGDLFPELWTKKKQPSESAPIPIIEESSDRLPEFTERVGDIETPTFAKILEMIIKYYATSGINVAIKFSEFNEFQKAYALLLGVLTKVGYNSHRANWAIRDAIVNWKNIPELLHVGPVSHVLQKYWQESGEYTKYEESLKNEPHGGFNDDQYLAKYLKYKTKYLEMKKKLRK